MRAYLLTVLLLVGNGTCMDLQIFDKYLNTNRSSNPDCQNQKDILLNSLGSKDLWAFKFLDSSGTIPSAIVQGNLVSLGYYDECVNIFEALGNETVEGKYCYGGLAISISDLEVAHVPVLQKELLLAVCVPNNCLPSDIFGDNGHDYGCVTKNVYMNYDNADILCVIFLSIILLLIISSTSYDLYLAKSSKEPRDPVLLAFSVYNNGKKILQINERGQISCFSGMKVMSMFWVILFHRFEAFGGTATNRYEYAEWKNQWHASYARMGYVAVETFFFISATLLTYNFLRSKREKVNIFPYYLHRYLRITPSLAVLYVVFVTVLRRMGSGPLWVALVEPRRNDCIEYWWSFFLFIHNYIHGEKMCLGHTWYLSIDVQFFILSPFILMALLKYQRKTVYTVASILLAFGTFYLYLIYDYFQITDYKFHMQTGFLLKFPAWLMGILFGISLSDYENKKEKYEIKNEKTIWMAWVAALGGMIFVVSYKNYSPIWALSLSWITFACINGYGGCVNRFLSLPIFQVLVKISYSAYLVHVLVILIEVGQVRAFPHFSEHEAIRSTIADIVISCVTGTVWALAFEYPFLALQQWLFQKSKSKTKEQ